MKRMTSVVLSSVALIVLSGCMETSVDSYGVDSYGVDTSGSGHDNLKVKLLDNATVQFSWKKGYAGYSEVLLRKEGVSSRTGYFMTHNYKGNYQLTCYVDSTYYGYVDFECVSTGADKLSSNATLPKVYFDTTYTVQMSEGIEHNYQNVTARLRYNSSSGSLEIF